MHCYVINLPTATKRLERTKRELATYCPKLSWSVPHMFVASEMTDAQFAALYDSEKAWRLHHYELSHGEIACALSHQSALREFLKTGDNCCLIVEDDVLFSPALGEFLDGLQDWMTTRGEKPTCVVLSEAAAVRYWTALRWIVGIRRTCPIDIFGAIAYVVNRAGAELILKANAVPIHMQSDYWSCYRKSGLDVFGVDKFLAGSFDFSRADSSLSAGRAETYQKNLAKRTPDQFFKRRIKALIYYVKRLWWWVTGVDTNGSVRTNDGLYRVCDRTTKY